MARTMLTVGRLPVTHAHKQTRVVFVCTPMPLSLAPSSVRPACLGLTQQRRRMGTPGNVTVSPSLARWCCHPAGLPASTQRRPCSQQALPICRHPLLSPSPSPSAFEPIHPLSVIVTLNSLLPTTRGLIPLPPAPQALNVYPASASRYQQLACACASALAGRRWSKSSIGAASVAHLLSIAPATSRHTASPRLIGLTHR